MSRNRCILQESARNDAVGSGAKAGDAVVECGHTLKWFWVEDIKGESHTKN